MSETAVAKNEISPPTTQLEALIDRAQKGDKSAVPALRELLQDAKNVDALGGDLPRQAQYALINNLAGKNLLYKESLNRKIELLRADLGSDQATPLERLLIDHIVTCWLHVNLLELFRTNRENLSIEMADYFERSLTQANRRYLAAVKTLATIRKLAVPVLQVNIAKKQVNIAAGAGVAPESAEAAANNELSQ